ncbi:Holliday junction resolvase RecU [Vagococcus penaei]|uniref:Holliday junction resolvase RecU n=1 Tax=Vagococcus penaei TaxID=633807 RepID=A0A1Q2D826_9ENTE|nr:Holliday junction resolvase RecU [Vagococcus penaei]AQP54461.1 Holliday junction resolvase RecU [Vagococcus penaei]RSU06380.1 Holliday junction resolvase RecU [Vagococcus penaei]
MTINYPNGQTRANGLSPKIKPSRKTLTYANRGMSFEELINQSNLYYLTKGQAVIHKKPTPIQIVQVNYPKRSAAKITEAYFKESSTTDYNGVYKGFYLDFEAKETKNKTSFPLSNFHAHQINHMEQCLKQNGLVFVLIWFSTLKRCFYLPADYVIRYWKEQANNGRKSIPLTTIETLGFEISLGLSPAVPYLEILEQHILKGDSHNGE